jgi:hypothetical protein
MRPPRFKFPPDPRPQNTYVWARWSELHRLIRVLTKVYTPLNWLIADAPPRSVHAIALFLRSQACRVDWPEVRIMTAGERASGLAAHAALTEPNLGQRLVGLARIIHENDHSVLVRRARPDAPPSLFPALDRCGETVRSRQFYDDLVLTMRDPVTAPFFTGTNEIDIEFLGMVDRAKMLDPMFIDAIASDRIPLGIADALNTLLRFMRQTRSSTVDIVFKDAIARWRPEKIDSHLESLLLWMPPPPVPWEGDDKLKPIPTPAALARAGRKFANCLRKHILDLVCGEMFFYEWEDPEEPAIIGLRHQPPLGWTIVNAHGPKNRALSAETRRAIILRLAGAGITTDLPLPLAIKTLRLCGQSHASYANP